MNIIETIKDSISSMRYGTNSERGLYWFIKIGSISLSILIVLAIAGVIYAKINGIDINLSL